MQKNRSYLRHIKPLVDWFGGQAPVALLALLIVATATWGFIEVAEEVSSGDTLAFDKWVVKSMRRNDDPSTPIGPRWLQEMGRDATAFGGIAALTLFTLVVAAYLWMTRRVRIMLLLLATTFSGLLISMLLKQVIGRPRPDIVPHLSHVYTSSFPSGHSMLSAVVFLTLGSLLTTTTDKVRIKAYFLGVAIVLTLIVGLSRIYLGVHYPTDVLAGWMAGLVWALVCWLIAHYLQIHRRIEQPDQKADDLTVADM